MVRRSGGRHSAARDSFAPPDNGGSNHPEPSQAAHRERHSLRSRGQAQNVPESSSSESESDNSASSTARSAPASKLGPNTGSGSISGSESEVESESESGADSGSGSESRSGESSESDSASEDESEQDEQKQPAKATASKKVARPTRRRATQKQQPKNPRVDYYFVRKQDVKGWERQQAVRRFRYLLGISDLFRHFVDFRAQRDPEFRAVLDEADTLNRSSSRRNERQTKSRRDSQAKGRGQNRKTQSRRGSALHAVNSEDADEEHMMEEADEDDEPVTVFTESPGFVKGTMRQYQIDGLNWLISLFTNSISGILADEMGLGKTYQTISFLSYLRTVRNVVGPHLVIVPKSTVQNWAREFEKWTPAVQVVILGGGKDERAELISDTLLKCNFDVCITSFELVIREKTVLQRFAWQYVIVDEAHRIKNEESILSRIMRVLHSRHRLLITGTPLQNNLHELWALLNFLLPDVFADSQVFDAWFQGHGGQDGEQDQDRVVEQLHRLLRPFLLRRVKADVEKSLLPKREINLYVGMSDMQIEWYQHLLEKDLDAVNGKGTGEAKVRLLNVMMQLRKCCNHPYLFEGAEPGPPFTTDEHLVQNSGKMILIDKLLQRLKAQGSRVLIFSQMGRMLDILEDYCGLRDYDYCRIDGSTVHEDRVSAIDEFNKPHSSKFLFLLTTRAGGLGINLTSADQVILYDSDWNPQADLQAMDRAHRIGQTKQVTVYRLVTEGAIEEKVLERAAHKLRLDQLVIQQGRSSAQEKAKAAASKEELVNMIRHGAQQVLDKERGTMDTQVDIDDIIRQGEARTAKLTEKYSGLGLDELQKFTFDAPTQPPVVQRHKSQDHDELADEFYHHRRRARHAAIAYDAAAAGPGAEEDDDEDISDSMTASGGSAGGSGGRKSGSARPPRQLTLHDFQFFDPRLADLQDRELAWYRRQAGIRWGPDDFEDDEEDESEERNAIIENAQPLTQEEQELKMHLYSEGFATWTKRDFHHFLALVTRLGRHNVEGVVEVWTEKPANEIRRYHKVFFERYREIADHQRYLAQLEAGETRARQQTHEAQLLKQKVESCRAPQAELPLNYQQVTSKRAYTEDEDRFLVVQMYELGLDTPNLSEKIRDRIRASGLFDFDWFMMSRTPLEITRRCQTLRMCITREIDGPGASGRGKRRAKARGDDSKRQKSEGAQA